MYMYWSSDNTDCGITDYFESVGLSWILPLRNAQYMYMYM